MIICILSYRFAISSKLMLFVILRVLPETYLLNKVYTDENIGSYLLNCLFNYLLSCLFNYLLNS